MYAVRELVPRLRSRTKHELRTGHVAIRKLVREGLYVLKTMFAICLTTTGAEDTHLFAIIKLCTEIIKFANIGHYEHSRSYRECSRVCRERSRFLCECSPSFFCKVPYKFIATVHASSLQDFVETHIQSLK